METQLVFDSIIRAAERGCDPEPFEDALALLTRFMEESQRRATAYARYIRELAGAKVVECADVDDAKRIMRCIEGMLADCAPVDFDSYMLYMEWNRDPSRQFWRPRRHVLMPVCRGFQDLEDGLIDLLIVSMPPRTGKSTTGVFAVSWNMGRWPWQANLMSGHSDKLTKGFHNEAVAIVSDRDTYRFAEVFPDAPFVDKNSADETVSLVRRNRFPTLTCRSADGTLTGAVEVGKKGWLYCDDLVSDREQALSSERMDKLYQTYLNQLRDRKKDGAKEVHVGTRWVPNDVIGRLMAEREGDPRCRIIVIPALDGEPYDEWVPYDEAERKRRVETLREEVLEVDEGRGMMLVRHPLGRTNFEYMYGMGFSTEYYEEMCASLCDAGEEDSWSAKYMGAPYYIGGLMFPAEELRTFDGLPEGEPDAVIAVCDTKDRGPDYACLPVAYVYGDDYYIVDVVCDNGLPEVVEPKIAKCLVRHAVDVARFESNSAGGRIADDMRRRCAEMGHTIDIRKKYSTENKETRILVDSLWVKERCIFAADAPNADYKRFMEMLTRYTTEGKNRHDDAPDAMSMLKRLAVSTRRTAVEAMKRPF